MVIPEKVIPLNWETGHVLDLMPSVEASPWGPYEGPWDVLGNAHLYQVGQGDRKGLLAVRPRELQHGRRLDVVGFASLGDRLKAQTVAQAVEQIAAMHHATQLAMCTQRAHIVKGATKNGWTITGMVLTKGLHRVQ